jgi:hypothetical protein
MFGEAAWLWANQLTNQALKQINPKNLYGMMRRARTVEQSNPLQQWNLRTLRMKISGIKLNRRKMRIFLSGRSQRRDGNREKTIALAVQCLMPLRWPMGMILLGRMIDP